MAGWVFNAINQPPFWHYDPRSRKTMWIYPANRQQFVIEGYALSGLCMNFCISHISSWGFSRALGFNYSPCPEGK